MLKVYTDGATSNNGKTGAVGGWAFIVLDEQSERLVSSRGKIDKATNNICELTAIIKACEACEEIMKPNETVVIYSDSAYCINCYKDNWYVKWLNNNWMTSSKKPVANKILWEKLIPYFTDLRFNFQKVKGHANDKWNILVDQMAVQARLS